MEVEVSLAGVSKVYNQGAAEVQALKGINLRFTGGDFKAIMGPSGCGKSTLLHILGCLDKPTTGTVTICGTAVEKIPPARLWELRNRTIGFIFQSHYLIESLTAIENVMLPLRYAKVPRREAYDRAAHLLKEMNLAGRMHHRPSQLSGGEKARVATARALVNNPMLILADEPTGELDSQTGRAVMELLSSLKHPSRILIIVTHDQEIAQWCDGIIRMRDGQVIED